MVETLNNLKNNKIKKGAASAQGSNDSKERISKFVSGIGKRYHVPALEPLRVSLDDLNKADSKGKWWLVGAAWGGDPLVERQLGTSEKKEKSVENELLKLARRQGMNTDVRRSIFVTLMSSDVSRFFSALHLSDIEHICVGLCGCMRSSGATQSNRGSATRNHSRPSPLLRQRKSSISH